MCVCLVAVGVQHSIQIAHKSSEALAHCAPVRFRRHRLKEACSEGSSVAVAKLQLEAQVRAATMGGKVHRLALMVAN